MVSHEALLDRLPPPLHSLQVAYRNHHFERVPTRDLIGAAEYLHRVFEASPGASPVRPIVAEMLVLLYHQVDDRLRRAPLSRDLLPQVDGVVWRRGSALAGLVDDIPPFMMLDVWISSLDHRVRVRHRATRRRVPQQQSPQPVNPPAPVVGGQPLPVPPAAQIDAALQ